MEKDVVLLDTSILIEYFRKKDKAKSQLVGLSKKALKLKVSSITKYEILVGSNQNQSKFWEDFFEFTEVLPFDSGSAEIAAQIVKKLKASNKLIDMADILIASVAIRNEVSLATLNKKHFQRI
ncbi:MAG: twitching motility protein PilT [Algoriphagus sp. 32-45-6]|nr:MAG: twitching motility protein PilT [Algoriphagus sp. 32-45-6]